MTNRERAIHLLHYEPVDRMPAVHFGYWPELLTEWAEQGHIPTDLAQGWYDGGPKDRELDRLIGWDFDWCHMANGNFGLYPGFETKVLEILPGGVKRVQNNLGLIERIHPGATSIPESDDYQLRDRESFETLYKPKMQYVPERVNTEYFKHFNENDTGEVPIGLHLGSVLGDVRSMLSVLGMSYLLLRSPRSPRERPPKSPPSLLST